MNRYELRQLMMTALNKTQRRNDPQVIEVVEIFVDQLCQLDNEHTKKIATLKAMFDADIEVLRREFEALKMERDALTTKTSNSNVVPLKKRDDDNDRSFSN
jgi:cell division protein FtsB